MSYFKRRKVASKVKIERPEFVQGHFMHHGPAKPLGRRWCFVADERWPCARGNKPGPLNPRDFFVFKPVSRTARFTGDVTSAPMLEIARTVPFPLAKL